MIYGPKQVILIVGINKIVKNIEEAEIRVRSYAAPIDAKRLNKDTHVHNWVIVLIVKAQIESVMILL